MPDAMQPDDLEMRDELLWLRDKLSEIRANRDTLQFEYRLLRRRIEQQEARMAAALAALKATRNTAR